MPSNVKYIPVLFVALLLSGCFGMLEPARYYIGGYTVHTEEARSESFRSEVKVVAGEITNKLGYDYSIKDSMGAVAIGINPKNWSTDPSHLRIQVWWLVNGTDRFTITVLKDAPEETEETTRIRKAIEDVINAHPSFRLDFDLTHRTMAR